MHLQRELMTEVLGSQSLLERDAATIDSFLKSVTKQPENFAAPSKKLSQQALHIAKTLFDHGALLNSFGFSHGMDNVSGNEGLKGPDECIVSRRLMVY